MNHDETAAWLPDTRVRRLGCAATDLQAAIEQVTRDHPGARLIRNQVGNLAVVVDGEQVGHLDLTFGRYEPW